MSHIVKAVCMLWIATLLGGCLNMDGEPAAEMTTSKAELTPEADYLSDVSVKAVEEGEGDTAVESALIWSEKYAQAVERLVRMQQENRQLAENNRKQTEQIIKLQQELKQYQKELGEANAMLMEMRTELEKWKTDVLGFRQEMRKAQTAQLVALHRVLKLLGGEVPSETNAVQTTSAEKEGNAQ